MKLIFGMVIAISIGMLVGCASHGSNNSSTNTYTGNQTLEQPATSAPRYHQPESPQTQAGRMISPFM